MRGFIEELRYRNVFRVAIAYIIAGWLIAQATDLAADAFDAPVWVMKMLIVVLLIGLPIARRIQAPTRLQFSRTPSGPCRRA